MYNLKGVGFLHRESRRRVRVHWMVSYLGEGGGEIKLLEDLEALLNLCFKLLLVLGIL